MLSVEMGNGGITFKCGTVVIRSKVIDGTFPDWQRVVPSLENEQNKYAKIDAADLDKALKVIVPKRGSRAPGVRFEFTKQKLVVSYTDPDSGKTSETLPCAYDAAPLTVGFNGGYVRDILWLARWKRDRDDHDGRWSTSTCPQGRRSQPVLRSHADAGLNAKRQPQQMPRLASLSDVQENWREWMELNHLRVGLEATALPLSYTPIGEPNA